MKSGVAILTRKSELLFASADVLHVGAQISSESLVQLQSATSVDLSAIRTAQDCMMAATNPDTLSELEKLVTIWCKQIEQVWSDWLNATAFLITAE